MNLRVPRSRVSHDRWLVSYADFITLMFAFFVVLYAFARADEKKQAQVSAAIHKAFQSMGGLATPARPEIKGGDAQGAPAELAGNHPAEEEIFASSQVVNGLDRLRSELAQALSSQIASHSVALEMRRDGLVISLREAGFFNSGSADPKAAALPTLQRIAAQLAATSYDLRVEGHTDNVPIHNAEFDSNWELSSARATRIARLFLELKGIPPDRVSAAGYAEFHPVAGNDTAEGRAENRRVDLVVMPRVSFNVAAPGTEPSKGAWQKVTDGD
ncbi:MAG: OmpA family protein [Terracidiphilus sp.]|jgi:chemotaxis protein MotB